MSDGSERKKDCLDDDDDKEEGLIIFIFVERYHWSLQSKSKCWQTLLPKKFNPPTPLHFKDIFSQRFTQVLSDRLVNCPSSGGYTYQLLFLAGWRSTLSRTSSPTRLDSVSRWSTHLLPNTPASWAVSSGILSLFRSSQDDCFTIDTCIFRERRYK